MGILLIIGKVLLSLFLTGLLIGGITKLLPAHRNPEADSKVEFIMGLLGVGGALAGFYFIGW